MTHKVESCMVAFPRGCNHATPPPLNATPHATTRAANNLLSLAERVLARSACNHSATLYATQQLHKGQNLVRSMQPSCIRVSCFNCQHFIPDPIGNGTGIGTCEMNATQACERPLYPRAKRFCAQFKRKELLSNENITTLKPMINLT